MWPVSQAFLDALGSSVHTVRIRAQVLNDSFNVVPGGEFYEATKKREELQNIIVDGNVDVDIERGARRKFQLNLLNKDAEFSPNSDWAGLFYVNRLIRLWRGIELGDRVEWVPVGTFMIDSADVTVESNMSMVTLAGQDLWKKFLTAQITKVQKFDVGTNVVDVIKWLATFSGVTVMSLDFLHDRDNASKLLADKLTFEVGDKVPDLLEKLAKDWGLEIFFNPLGSLTVQPTKDPTDRSVVWHFKSAPGHLLISAKATYTDDVFYNVALVIGTADKANPIYSERADTDATSPTNVNKVGRRVNKLESDTIKTQSQADAACKTLYYSGFFSKEVLNLEAICNPALAGNDAVRVTEPNYAKVDAIYRLLSYSVPLAGSRQTLRVQRMVNI